MSEPGTSTTQARSRLREALSWRRGRGTLISAVLLGALGFTAAIQIIAPDDVLDRASRADLIQILDGLDTRADQLEDEIVRLETARSDLIAGAGDNEAALDEARQRLDTLGILAGSLAAQGPGVEVRVADPGGDVDATALLGVVQELRNAKAEALQINGAPDRAVRIVASTAFVDLPAGGVAVGGVGLQPPYTLVAIGDPATISPALGIPGGAVSTLESAGAGVSVRESDELVVDALHEAGEPSYAQPAVPDELDPDS